MPSPAASANPIRLEIEDAIGRVTINRPPFNILGIDTLDQLNDALRRCQDAGVRAVLLESALPRVFSAGVEVRDHVSDRVDAMLTVVRENARLLLDLSAVTIAAINGSTLGGGAELALLCDLVIAADDTVLGFPEIRLAAFPPIAAVLLPDRCSSSLGMRLLLGESIDAATAYAAGLVSMVVPSDRLHEVAAKQVKDISGVSAVALQALIATARRSQAADVLQKVDAAMATYRRLIGPSRDAQEGIDAFLEKRAPTWSHR